jgi:hypothetical protein
VLLNTAVVENEEPLAFKEIILEQPEHGDDTAKEDTIEYLVGSLGLVPMIQKD